MTFLFQTWRLSNLQERMIVAQYLCSYKFPAILKWLSGESEFIDLKLQFSSYIIHRCDERGDVCSRYILCFPYLNIDWGWPGVGEDQGHTEIGRASCRERVGSGGGSGGWDGTKQCG